MTTREQNPVHTNLSINPIVALADNELQGSHLNVKVDYYVAFIHFEFRSFIKVFGYKSQSEGIELLISLRAGDKNVSVEYCISG